MIKQNIKQGDIKHKLLKLYNIYPPCFGGGFGEITKYLDIIERMGFNAIWLNPFLKVGAKDNEKIMRNAHGTNNPYQVGGSLYAATWQEDKNSTYVGSDGKMHHHYKMLQLFSNPSPQEKVPTKEIVQQIKDFNTTAIDKGLIPMFDLVLNHISCDSKWRNNANTKKYLNGIDPRYNDVVTFTYEGQEQEIFDNFWKEKIDWFIDILGFRGVRVDYVGGTNKKIMKIALNYIKNKLEKLGYKQPFIFGELLFEPNPKTEKDEQDYIIKEITAKKIPFSHFMTPFTKHYQYPPNSADTWIHEDIVQKYLLLQKLSQHNGGTKIGVVSAPGTHDNYPLANCFPDEDGKTKLMKMKAKIIMTAIISGGNWFMLSGDEYGDPLTKADPFIFTKIKPIQSQETCCFDNYHKYQQCPLQELSKQTNIDLTEFIAGVNKLIDQIEFKQGKTFKFFSKLENDEYKVWGNFTYKGKNEIKFDLSKNSFVIIGEKTNKSKTKTEKIKQKEKNLNSKPKKKIPPKEKVAKASLNQNLPLSNMVKNNGVNPGNKLKICGVFVPRYESFEKIRRKLSDIKQKKFNTISFSPFSEVGEKTIVKRFSDITNETHEVTGSLFAPTWHQDSAATYTTEDKKQRYHYKFLQLLNEPSPKNKVSTEEIVQQIKDFNNQAITNGLIPIFQLQLMHISIDSDYLTNLDTKKYFNEKNGNYYDDVVTFKYEGQEQEIFNNFWKEKIDWFIDVLGFRGIQINGAAYTNKKIMEIISEYIKDKLKNKYDYKNPIIFGEFHNEEAPNQNIPIFSHVSNKNHHSNPYAPTRSVIDRKNGGTIGFTTTYDSLSLANSCLEEYKKRHNSQSPDRNELIKLMKMKILMVALSSGGGWYLSDGDELGCRQNKKYPFIYTKVPILNQDPQLFNNFSFFPKGDKNLREINLTKFITKVNELIDRIQYDENKAHLVNFKLKDGCLSVTGNFHFNEENNITIEITPDNNLNVINTGDNYKFPLARST